MHWIPPFVWAALTLTVLAHALRWLGQEDVLMLRGPRWYAPAVIFTLVWMTLIFATEGFTPLLYVLF